MKARSENCCCRYSFTCSDCLSRAHARNMAEFNFAPLPWRLLSLAIPIKFSLLPRGCRAFQCLDKTLVIDRKRELYRPICLRGDEGLLAKFLCSLTPTQMPALSNKLEII